VLPKIALRPESCLNGTIATESR